MKKTAEIIFLSSEYIKHTATGLTGGRHIYSDDIMFYHFTVTVSATYTPFCAYTHIVQVPLPTAWISPSGVTVATAVLQLS